MRSLWKPISESTGGLAFLTDAPTSSVRLIDLQTGEVVATGRRDTRAGMNNGYRDGYRFDASGNNFSNVAIVDDQGRVIGKIGNGGARVEMSYDSLDDLYKTPPSTFKGTANYQGASQATPSQTGQPATVTSQAPNEMKQNAMSTALGVGGNLALNTAIDPVLLGLATGNVGAVKDAVNTDNSGQRAANAAMSMGMSEAARALGWGRPSRDYANEAKSRVGALQEKGIKTHDFGDMSGFGVKNPNVKNIDDTIKTAQATDIWGLPAIYERYGNDWLGKMSEEERRKTSQDIINSGALINKDNQLDIDWQKFDTWKGSNPSQVTLTPAVINPTNAQPAPMANNGIFNKAVNLNQPTSTQEPVSSVGVNEIAGAELAQLMAQQDQEKMFKQNLALSMVGGDTMGGVAGSMLNQALSNNRERKFQQSGANIGNILLSK